MLAALAVRHLVPVALGVELDLGEDADEELVHVVGQARGRLDELAAAAVGQASAHWTGMTHVREIRYFEAEFCAGTKE